MSREEAHIRAGAHQDEIALETIGHGDMTDITGDVARIVAESGIRIGTVNIFNVGSTGAIGAIEFESGLERDLPTLLDRLIPASRDWGHEQTWHDGNGHSHLQATWLGQSMTVPVTDSRPNLGTWQQIIHLECDVRSRSRRIVVTVVGV